MLKLNLSETSPLTSQSLFNKNQIEVLLIKNSTNSQKNTIPHKNILQTHQSQVITVPIKEYSNKFLRQKKNQQLQTNNQKKQPFLNTHLQNNRKLISDFKKMKVKTQKFRKSINNENGDFIIHNLLFQKSQSSLIPTSNLIHKTIFGNFAQNCINTQSIQQINEESSLFDKGWKTVKNENPFQTKKEVYQKICQKQKSLIPEYRKKSKTFTDVSNIQTREEKDKKIERISTSRALQKYSKIIKVNPEHGKLEKMKIKKQLAKSLRFESSQKGDFETKQMILFRKQTSQKYKNNLILQEANRNYSIDHTNKQNQNDVCHLKTPEKSKIIVSKENLCLSKIGMFTGGSKLKRMRKFSHQIQHKKCMTQQKNFNQNEDSLQDFQINGWDINI